MPYKVVGNKLMHFKNGKWSVKQTAESPSNAKAAMRLLEGLEHNWQPMGKPRKMKSRG